MKNLLYIIVFFIIIGCSSNKTVYWCGDHACINKKDKEAYFKKTMIIEIKEFKKEGSKNKSEIEKIIQQAEVEEKKAIKKEKKLINQTKLEQKRRANEEKILTKQAKLEQKRRAKEEKMLTKQAKLEQKRRAKEEKILAKQIKRDEKKILKNEKRVTKKNIAVKDSVENIVVATTDFKKLVEKITKENSFRPYPDINDIPN